MAFPYRLSSISIASGATYRSAGCVANGEALLGVTVRSDQALSVSLAYGRVAEVAAAEGASSSASLPFGTATQSFAAAAGAEGGTYHEFALPATAQQYQLVISNASGSSASVDNVDWNVQDSVTGE